jgi:hypothetical protein
MEKPDRPAAIPYVPKPARSPEVSLSRKGGRRSAPLAALVAGRVAIVAVRVVRIARA